jgi:hypothetical protein
VCHVTFMLFPLVVELEKYTLRDSKAPCKVFFKAGLKIISRLM